MSTDLFRLWYDFLSNAPRTGRPGEEGFSLAREGLSNLQELTRFWQRMWKDPFSLFYPPQMTSLFSAFGLVPIQEHLSLIQKYEEMKDRVAAHEETIRNLRLLLKKRGCEPEELQTTFQDVMKNQMDAFFTLMRGGMRLLPYK